MGLKWIESSLCIKDKKQLDKEKFYGVCKEYCDYVISRDKNPYASKLLLIEELLNDNCALTAMPDYKFFCSFGKVFFAYFATGGEDVKADSKRYSFYKIKDWKKMPLIYGRHPPVDFDCRPKSLKKMIEISEKLSYNLPLIRVDLYECNGKVYFGEFTTYSGDATSIFEPTIWDYKLGKIIGKVVSVDKLKNMIDDDKKIYAEN